MSQPQWRSAPPAAPPPPWAGPPNQWGQQPQWGPRVQYAPTQQWSAPPGYRPGYGPPGRPPAPRRSPLGRLLLAVMGLSLLALLALVLASAVTGGETRDGAYVNDDYQVPAPDLNPPPIPFPETFNQAEQWLTENAVYGEVTPAPVRCEVPAIDVARASDAALDAHFNDLVECLVRVWQPPLTAAGFQLPRPSVTIYTEQISTRCGSGRIPRNAFYCPADQQIYWSNTLGDILAPFDESPRAGDQIMAHEFGHALQGRTGIIASSQGIRQNTSDKRAGLELGRRTELQADCFAGQFMRSVSTSLGLEQADVQRIQRDFFNSGDDVLSGDPNYVGDHGRGRSRQAWGSTGLGTDQVGQCNTFTAPADQVR
jgi:predicted metalloprotease